MDYEEFRQQDGYFYVIYKIINLIDNKFYIGRHRTKDLNDNYYGSGIRINYAIKKYGIENFKREYLYFLSNDIELINKECELVNEELIKRDDSYNISLGGPGSFKFAQLKVVELLKTDKEFRKQFGEKVRQGMKKFNKENPDKKIELSRKVSLKLKGRKSPMKGRKQSQKQKDIASSLMSIKQKGESNVNFGKFWITNKILKENKIITNEEFKNYNSDWSRGRKSYK